MRQQLARAWYIARKDMRTHYLKAPLISWGMLFPLVMILAFYLRDPVNVRAVAPGLIGMTVLFGGTSMEAVVIAFEKRIGAMERLMMAPISPAALVLGKALSGALFAMATGTLAWLGAALFWGLRLAPVGVVVSIVLGSATFSLMGVVISLLMREVFDAMTMSNYFRFPMVFLCGVFMPLSGMALPLRIVAAVLPLSYLVDALRHLLLAGEGAAFPLAVDLAVSCAYAIALGWLALRLMRTRLEDLL
jgi:ABC-2 type transport system permease protein